MDPMMAMSMMAERMPLDPPLPVPPPSPPLPAAFLWDALAVVPRPYSHAFETSVKGRWIGRTAVDVFAQEFPYYPRAFYEAQLAAGHLQVRRRGVIVAPDEASSLPLKTGDLVRHVVHRHELPVLNGGPLVVSGFVPASAAGVLSTRDTDGLLCVDKPASLPAHPCGRYHRASVAEMLAAGYFTLAPDVWQRRGKVFYEALQRQLRAEPVHTVHRLDKATSGLMLVATNRRVAAAVHAALDAKSTEDATAAAATGDDGAAVPTAIARGKTARPEDAASESAPSTKPDSAAGEVVGATAKQYLARVAGRFPGGGAPVRVSRAIYCASHREGRFAAVSEAEEAARRTAVEEAEQQGRAQPSAGAGDAPPAAGRGTDVESAKLAMLQARGSGDAEAAAAATELKREAQRRASDHGRAGGADCDGPENARWAETVFRLRHYNASDDTSVVECRPVTGRTHQLRVHLGQVLGHPIVLDAIYGPAGGAAPTPTADADRERLVRRLFCLPFGGSAADPTAGEPLEKGCPECDGLGGRDAAWPGREFWESFLCLHALSYTVQFPGTGSVTFAVPEPQWAAPEE